MSTYTDQEHDIALRDTLYWQGRTIDTTEKMYGYAEYLYRLKDYETAAVWYEKAAIDGFFPAMYKLALGWRRGLIETKNEAQVQKYFVNALAYFRQKPDSPENCYTIGICLRYGYGVFPEERKAFEYFNCAEDNCASALYEVGLYYRDGIAGVQQDKEKAKLCFRRAYDGHYEDAIFALFLMHKGPFEEFPYIREIKEAYSFKLGQLMRIAEVKPSYGSLKRLAAFYRQGFPGDAGAAFENFQKKADSYEKKALQGSGKI